MPANYAPAAQTQDRSNRTHPTPHLLLGADKFTPGSFWLAMGGQGLEGLQATLEFDQFVRDGIGAHHATIVVRGFSATVHWARVVMGQ